MPSTRRQYSEKFKQETVRRYSESGKPVQSFARHIGIDQSILHRWLKRYGDYTDEPSVTEDKTASSAADEIKQLKRELASVRHTVETLRGIIEKSFISRYQPDNEFDTLPFR